MNAIVARIAGDVAGMVLSYPIETAPEDDPDDLPAPIAPFVSLEKHAVGTWYINALAVYPEHQGRGLGRSLLKHAESQAQQQGHDKVSIQVYAQNHGAVKLYGRLGYEMTSREPVREHPCHPYYTGDVFLLIKRLTERPIGPTGKARDH